MLIITSLIHSLLKKFEFLEDSDDSKDDEKEFSEKEIIERRKIKLERLARLYRMQYYRLRDMLATKHQKFLKLRENKFKKLEKTRSKQKKSNEVLKIRGLKDKKQQQIDTSYGNYHNLQQNRMYMLMGSDKHQNLNTQDKMNIDDYQKYKSPTGTLMVPPQSEIESSYITNMNYPYNNYYPSMQYTGAKTDITSPNPEYGSYFPYYYSYPQYNPNIYPNDYQKYFQSVTNTDYMNMVPSSSQGQNTKKNKETEESNIVSTPTKEKNKLDE